MFKRILVAVLEWLVLHAAKTDGRVVCRYCIIESDHATSKDSETFSSLIEKAMTGKNS